MTSPPLPVGVLRQIDGICDDFERSWQAGSPPRLEALLAAVPEEARPALFRCLLRLEQDYRRQRGDPLTAGEAGLRFGEVGDWARDALAERGLCAEAAEDTGDVGETSGSAWPVSARSGPARDDPLPGGYTQEELLGEGGMGAVYRAYDPALERTVALKRLRPDRLLPGALERFHREGRVLARLQHPHIVQVFGWTEQGGEPALVLEYVPGGTLERRLGEGSALDPATSARLVEVLARAVQAAHEAGIVHRDLKPANVLMAPPVGGDPGTVLGGFPKVSDFGLAQLAAAGPGQTVSGVVMGTPAYMAPEQAEGRTSEVGPGADVWALGVILYRCLTGRQPFAGDSVLATLEKVKRARPAPPRSVLPGVPGPLEAICLRCLRKAPARRYPSAGALADELRRWTDGKPPAETAPWRPWRPAGLTRRRVLLAGLGGAAAALAGLAWLSRQRDGEGPAGGSELGGGGQVVAAEPPRSPLQIRRWRAMHYVKQGDEHVGQGPLGEKSFATRYGDVVTLTVELSGPAYFYLIAFNFDGKEQLLWPVDEKGEPDPGRAPPRLGRLRFPQGDGGALGLEDNDKGGLQAYVVAASRRPLPAYKAWRKGLGELGWKAWPAGRTVWQADALGTYGWVPGVGLDRSLPKVLAGVPPLGALCRKLTAGGVEAVEALAFPVAAKEGGR
jgi:serine/threonine-protein kinase